LLASARDLAVATGARRIVLETARTNTGAQRLYESLGYRCENEAVRFYALELGEPVVIRTAGPRG
jgi:ribosomal protein S18 acetylase RimI-like enzyme